MLGMYSRGNSGKEEDAANPTRLGRDAAALRALDKILKDGDYDRRATPNDHLGKIVGA